MNLKTVITDKNFLLFFIHLQHHEHIAIYTPVTSLRNVAKLMDEKFVFSLW